jgi:replication factor A1
MMSLFKIEDMIFIICFKLRKINGRIDKNTSLNIARAGFSRKRVYDLSEGTVERSGPQPVNVKIGELTPNLKALNVTVKVVSKGEVRSNTSGRDFTTHRVVDALVGDETGCVYLNLWDDNIEKIKEGDTLNIKNGYINLFRGNMRLNIGRYGSFETVKESKMEEVNTENNLSSKRYEQERRFERYSGGSSRSF